MLYSALSPLCPLSPRSLLVEIHALSVHLNRNVFTSLVIALETRRSHCWRWNGCIASWNRLQGYLIAVVLHEAATGACKVKGFTLSLP